MKTLNLTDRICEYFLSVSLREPKLLQQLLAETSPPIDRQK